MEEALAPLKSIGLGETTTKEQDPIPWDRATIQQEYKKCRNILCGCRANNNKPKKIHGPYLYAYWKDKGKLRKKYVGKSVQEYKDKLYVKAYGETTGKNWTFTQWNKYNFIKLVANCGSKIARGYEHKLGIISGNKQLDEIVTEAFNDIDGIEMKQGRVPSIDWAYRVVREEVQRNPKLKSQVYAKLNVESV